MEVGTISKWQVAEGDFIESGSVIADVETDKAVVAFEAVDEGYLAKILLPEGASEVAIGTPVAILVEDKEMVSAFKDYTPDGSASSAPSAEAEAAPAPATESAAPPPKPATPAPSAPTSSDGSRIFASPLARSIAAEMGIDLAAIGQGSGPKGRITKSDVDKYAATAPEAKATATAEPVAETAAPSSFAPGKPYEEVPLSGMRKTIAARLTTAKRDVPHYYLSITCNVDNLVKTRAELNKRLEKDGTKLSVNDFIIKASALSMGKVPEVNSSFMDTFIRQYDYVDVCVAVATPGGLITPIVGDADRLGLVGISDKVRELATKAKDGGLQPHEYQGGTFTVSNLGMFGVSNFSAIINPPQAAILAVGGTDTRIIQTGTDEEGKPTYSTSKTMTVTLSCDHRVVDGAVGAKWLQAFKGYIEDPMSMLL
eukprot:CAMPEP_0184478638 /NCGR_PEP_ID=MMETSP0113_2-20130426/609_1 /TAXON_ID=91329 /ORGANISM="Norrisiella sphaerica, Strain BC52" /LENGTH=425 /DNA_ID=CAMNT_0026856501 /DNA_START=233 /DNA_END=1510 /DNA_ORIENTATION=-